MEHVHAAFLYTIICTLDIMDQKYSDANGCIGVHALMDWGPDVVRVPVCECVFCAHMSCS